MNQMKPFYFLMLAAFADMASAEPLRCRIDPLVQYTHLGGQADDQQIEIEADQVNGDFNKTSFSGQVRLKQGNRHLLADKLDYSKKLGRADTEGKTVMSVPDLVLEGRDAHYDANTHQLQITDADYYLATSGVAGQGHVADVRSDLSKKTVVLKDVVWSTCPRDHQVWSVKAKSLEINQAEKKGALHHAVLRIKDIPVFYIPYYPLSADKSRKSGLLLPSLASTDNTGFAVNIPVYWNIAPNQDATFTLTPMTKRGLMLGGEYRFLTTKQYGMLSGHILAKDKADNNQARWSYRFDYTYRFNPDWRADLLYQDVSDLHYLSDFDGGQAAATLGSIDLGYLFNHFDSGLSLHQKWYLKRNINVDGKLLGGHLHFLAEDYKRASDAVSEQSVPYSRLPALSYDFAYGNNDYSLGLDAETVHFAKTPEQKKVEGWRNAATLSAQYQFTKPWGYLKPALKLNARNYQLSGGAVDSRSYVIPSLSLDGGLYFDRHFQINQQDWTQTIEPRLFYLYTPYVDQSDIPVFDSALRAESWGGLFSDNRFSGKDRIGDANQLTTALTTRLLDNKQGIERFNLSVGQIQYFSDRKVQLSGTKIDKATHSTLIAQASAQPVSGWNIHATTFWDTDSWENKRWDLATQYQIDDDRLIGFKHSYKPEDHHQLGIYTGWKLSPNWRIFARYDHSLRYQQYFNMMAGVEYNDCCASWRIVAKRYRDKPDDVEAKNGIYAEFDLKGLFSLGNNPESVLRKQINGYRPIPAEQRFE